MTTPWAGSADVDAVNGQVLIGSPVTGNVIYKQLNYIRGRPALYLGSDEIRARVSCYVPAANDRVMADHLWQNRAIGLSGPVGSGRETTAIAIMRRLYPGLPIRRFALGEEEIDDAPQGYLIRLTPGNEADLGACVEGVRKSGGYLAAMAGTPIEIENFAWFSIEPPLAHDVFQSWVMFRRLPQWADWDRAKVLLEDHRPSDAYRLAELALRASRGGGDLAQQQNEVERAYLGWDDELRVWFRAHDNPLERILLIAAVIVPDGLDEAFAYDAAAKLAETLDPERNGAGLAWCPVTGIRDMLGADHDGERITFRRIGYAEAALRHAFADYPLARADLFSWLAALPSSAGGDGVGIAQTFASLAARYGETDRITSAALEFGHGNQPDLAYTILSQTCTHPRVGAGVRSALYEWSRTPGLAVTMKLVIARTCEVLGETSPSVALTRLKHLATWGGSQVIGQVIDSALALAEFGHGGLVLREALDWCDPGKYGVLPASARQRRRRAGAMLFLRLSVSVDAIGSSCIAGWRAALDFRDHRDTDHAALVRVFDRWLDTALAQPQLRDAVVETFVAAGAPRLILDANGVWGAKPDRGAARFVIALADAWAAADPAGDRAVLADRVAVPLTYPWWRRVLRRACAWIRTRRVTASARG